MKERTASRIVFALDRLPQTMAIDDHRLPNVVLTPSPLRLNSEPVPARFLRPRMDHEARIAAMLDWLKSQCGDYRPASRAFIDAYVDFAAEEILRNEREILQHLAQFDGLFEPRAFIWSTLRPLPRAWLDRGGSVGMGKVDFAFWDGSCLYAVAIDTGATRPMRTERTDVLTAFMSHDMLRRDGPAAIRQTLPWLGGFWRRQRLPLSPFRRPWQVHL